MSFTMSFTGYVSSFADVLKFFGCELGAQTKFSGDSGTCIVNGENGRHVGVLYCVVNLSWSLVRSIKLQY